MIPFNFDLLKKSLDSTIDELSALHIPDNKAAFKLGRRIGWLKSYRDSIVCYISACKELE
jgi:hypothetical protein